MKKYTAIFLTVLLLASMLLCTGCMRSVNDKVYKDDLSTAKIAADSCAQLSAASFVTEADEDYIRYSMQLNESVMKECTVYIQNSGSSLDEFGVIKATADTIADLEDTVKNYLTRRNDEWTGMYLVEEYPKLRDAEYKIFGNYLVYGILSENDKDLLFTAVEAALLAS